MKNIRPIIILLLFIAILAVLSSRSDKTVSVIANERLKRGDAPPQSAQPIMGKQTSPAAKPREDVSVPCRDESDETTVGAITLSPPEAYLVVEDIKAKKRRLYNQKDYEKIKNKDLKIVQSVLLDRIEYRYKSVKGKVEFVSEEFELVELVETQDKKTAVLKRDYVERPEATVEQREVPREEIIEPVEEEVKAEEETPKQAPIAKRLLAELFYKIDSKKISDREWEVSLPTTLEAAANFRAVLAIVAKKIDDLRDPAKRTKIYFNTSLGKGALSSDGLLVESLSSGLGSKCGIKNDDLIKTVNGKGLTSIQDVALIFAGFSGSPQTITVKLLRGDSELTLTYYVK